MTSNSCDLELTHVRKSYPIPGGELPILVDVNLRLSRGDALAITGPSGAGKSTLLYMIGTLDTPTAGAVRILGTDPFALGSADLARFRNANIGFVFQEHYLLPQCSVLENVLIPTLAGDGAEAAQARAQQLLARVGLAERLRHRPAELSGGERQRVAICRALINQPPILLADEPTGNLDRHTAEAVGGLLLELSREQNAMLMVVTHSAELAASLPRRADLVDGKLVES
ncbi:MAG: ABC transporter ATP-binding protein [Planctomycetes bacterium]|nr:ABC transporter ATP-binding protein [Planctomycetota bacterium]